MSERMGGRRTRTVPNRPYEENGGDGTPTLSESPAQSKGVFAEAETEALADAVIADSGGALAIITFLGQNLPNVILAISILAIAPIARLIRSATLSVSQREFVLAARSLGAKNWRIITREILPVVMLPVFSYALIGVAVAVTAEGALAFLGLSVAAPTPTWGGMITDGRVYLQQDPWIAFIPAIVLFITVLALNFAGDSLRTRFDVREGGL